MSVGFIGRSPLSVLWSGRSVNNLLDITYSACCLERTTTRGSYRVDSCSTEPRVVPAGYRSRSQTNGILVEHRGRDHIEDVVVGFWRNLFAVNPLNSVSQPKGYILPP